MTPRPLRAYAAPGYPTALQVRASPRLLERKLPGSWRREELLVALATAAALSQSACAPKKVPLLVAPVSSHGEGLASVGCIVIAPPVFLSEEDALAIIKDEAGRRGLSLAPATTTVLGPDLALPGTERTTRAGFVPDLASPAKRVAVEFISRTDVPRPSASAYEVRTREVATELAANARLDGANGFYFGVFYDPAGQLLHCRDDCAAEKLAKLASNEDELRAQVKDFLDWLQAQGAL